LVVCSPLQAQLGRAISPCQRQVQQQPRIATLGLYARCSGYVATAQYEAGLAYCNRALELYEAIWRKRQNNAAARLGSGQIAVA